MARISKLEMAGKLERLSYLLGMKCEITHWNGSGSCYQLHFHGPIMDINLSPSMATCARMIDAMCIAAEVKATAIKEEWTYNG
jgi:hypothetical protein